VGNLLKQVHEVQWRWLHALRIPEAKCRKKLVALSGQPVDCTLTGSQQTKLGFCSNAETKQFVRALDRLERLA
jgi:phosphoglycolate phosphatase-like HAD superfamily hydrolase